MVDVTEEMETEVDEIAVHPSLLTCVICFLVFLIPIYVQVKYAKTSFVGAARKWKTAKCGSMEITVQNEIVMKLKSEQGKEVFAANIGESIPPYAECEIMEMPDGVEIVWEGYAVLTVRRENQKYNIEWKNINVSHFEDSLHMLGYHWYGMGHVWNQPWPLNCWNVQMSPMVSGEFEPFKRGEWYGGIQERLWLSSTGVALFVDQNCPLFASVNHKNDQRLTLVAKNEAPYRETNISLKYSLIQTSDVKQAYMASVGKAFEKPEKVPDRRMFRSPVWSTWAEYKQEINQQSVLEFAKQIREHGFKDAQLEIDDDWTEAYGDWNFDAKKFPDPDAMIKELKEMGFRVTIWMHPFADVQSNAIKEKKLWIQKDDGNPAIVSWWNGKAVLLDVSNPEAREWFKQRCKQLKDIGIDSFKIDAGEANYLPYERKTYRRITPNEYNKMFVDLCYEIDTNLCCQEVRSAVGSQKVPVFFRLNDKDSNWSTVNGLKTVIPHVLNQGLLGYPFVLPDMIGGNAYSLFGFSKTVATSRFPNRELFIRWMQVNTLMPAMQFSIAPWRYDDQVVDIARKLCHLHENYADLICQLAEEATRTGSPICRPLWWIAPNDPTALTISTEFLLGDHVLVAPVLDEGARDRDVYLPEGKWRDENTLEIIEGPQWIRKYPAPIDVLPHFVRM